jgi:hypothetical protein
MSNQATSAGLGLRGITSTHRQGACSFTARVSEPAIWRFWLAVVSLVNDLTSKMVSPAGPS